MIRHLWTIPCRVSILNSYSNNISLIEVVEEIEIPANLTTLAKNIKNYVPAFMDLVSVWTRGDMEVPETGYGKIEFVAPSEETLFESVIEIDLREAVRFRSTAKLLGLPLKAPGHYHFVISLRSTEQDPWQVMERVPLSVRVVDEEIKNPPPSTNGHA